jgi:hypothetical protein
MTGSELARLNNAARTFFSRWAPRCPAGRMMMHGRRLTLSASASGIATALYHNPVNGRIECWGVDLQQWRSRHRIVPKLLRA